MFFVDIFGMFGICSPPIPGVNVKVPFWGEKYRTKFLLLIVCDVGGFWGT